MRWCVLIMHAQQSSRAHIGLGVHLPCCRRPRLLGAGPGSKVGPHHVFGMPSARESEPCVGELIRSGCSQQQQEHEVDPGLGKSPTRWRNTSETAERVSCEGSWLDSLVRQGTRAPGRHVRCCCHCLQIFGLPSARTDVPLPVMRSVANTHNYGNEQTGEVMESCTCFRCAVQWQRQQ